MAPFLCFFFSFSGDDESYFHPRKKNWGKFNRHGAHGAERERKNRLGVQEEVSLRFHLTRAQKNTTSPDKGRSMRSHISVISLRARGERRIHLPGYCVTSCCLTGKSRSWRVSFCVTREAYESASSGTRDQRPVGTQLSPGPGEKCGDTRKSATLRDKRARTRTSVKERAQLSAARVKTIALSNGTP